MGSDLDRTVLQTDLLHPGESVVVACSGGPESVALLHLLRRAPLDLRLHVAHLDHALRPESHVDAGFVEELAASLALPVSVGRRDASDRSGHGPAAAARSVRLAFLEEVARAVGATAIATGHQRDDQAETLLQRVLTGAGTRGLRGIPATRTVAPDLRYVRPLLSCSRRELSDWLEERGLAWRDDPSNRTPTFRARLRHEAMPLLSEIASRDVRPLLAATAKRMSEADGLIEDAAAFVSAFVRRGDRELRLAPGIEHLPPALLHTGLAAELATLSDTRMDDGDVADLVHGRRHVAGLECVRLRDGTRLVRAASSARDLGEHPLELPGTVDAEGLGVFSVAELPVTPASLATVLRAVRRGPSDVIDGDRLVGPCVMRGPVPGDRLTPLGSEQPARLSHVLQRRGVAAALRARTPVLADAQGVVVVPGVVVAERVAVRTATQRPMLVRWTPHRV